jgi:hypothetical protein
MNIGDFLWNLSGEISVWINRHDVCEQSDSKAGIFIFVDEIPDHFFLYLQENNSSQLKLSYKTEIYRIGDFDSGSYECCYRLWYIAM